MVRGLASVLVYVRDMEASVDFYARLLGVEVAHRDATTAQFAAGNLRLVLHRDKLPPRAGVRGAMEFDLEVEDAGAYREELARRGVPAPPPQRYPWGWTGFAVTDPDGNVVEVYEIPE